MIPFVLFLALTSFAFGALEEFVREGEVEDFEWRETVY
jgi:hypothetical protein